MERFAKGGPGWAPLSEATIAIREARGTIRPGVEGDQPILQEEGDLRRSVMASAMGGGENHIEIITADRLTYGTNLKKAPRLQAGDPSKNLPARPFLFIDNETRDAVLYDAETYLRGKIAEVFSL